MGQWKAKLWAIMYQVSLCGWEGWVGGWVEGDAGWAQDFLELLFDSCSRSTQSGRPCVIKIDSDVHQ